MSISFPTQGHHVYSMCPDIIFQILLPHSRLMTSHHVTSMSHVSSLSKTKQNKKKTKSLYSQKIKEKENKNCLCPKYPITKGMMIWLAAPHVVSVSASYSRCCYLALSLWFPHVLIVVATTRHKVQRSHNEQIS